MESATHLTEQTAHIRSINQTAEFFKSIDPDTAIKAGAIRRAVNDGKINHISVGNRKLITLESAYRFFYGHEMPQ